MKYEELEKLLEKIDNEIKKSQERQEKLEKISLDYIVEQGIQRGIILTKIDILDFYEENKKK